MKRFYSSLILLLFTLNTVYSFCCGNNDVCLHNNQSAFYKINKQNKTSDRGCCDHVQYLSYNTKNDERAASHDDCSCRAKETVYNYNFIKSELTAQISFYFINNKQINNDIEFNFSYITNNYASKFFTYRSLIYLYSSLLC